VQSDAPKKKGSPKAFCWLFIGIGVVMIGVGLNLAFQSFRCKSWPTTEATIRTAEMGRHRGSKGSTTYSPDVSYDYSVDGSHYTGTKVAFGMMSSSSSYARGVLQHYRVGAKVPVYYSPTNPAKAVLETGIHGGTWICFGVGTVFALFGIMFLQMVKQQPASDQTSSAAVSDGKQMNAPPKLMGVIVCLFGLFAIVGGRTDPTKAFIAYTAGALFCVVGLYIFTYRPEKNLWSRLLQALILLLFLGVFHLVAFSLGKVEVVFAVVIGVIDLIIFVVGIRWMFNRIKVKAPGL
jgi:hypothetical protein